MSISSEFGALFRRDLRRLARQAQAFPDDASFWKTLPGVTNPAGNLMLHLEGNLREYIGRILMGMPYERSREREFGSKDVTQAELGARMAALGELIPALLESLPEARWSEPYPQEVLGLPMTNHQFVTHLHGHFNYHLGQIDYLRRILTAGAALKPVSLEPA